MLKRYQGLFAAAVVLAGWLVPGATQAANEVVFNVFPGPRHHVNVPFKAWAAEVEKVTSGRVTIKFLPTSAAPPPKQIDGVVSGQFDAAFIFNGFTAKRAVGPQFGMLPFMLNANAEIGSVAYWRTYQKFFAGKKEFDKIGIRILSAFHFPGNYFHSGDDTPIRSVADMKSRKMWALAGTPSHVLKNAGVNHVSGPAARVNEFTQTNVVSGLAGISFDGVRGFGALSFVKSSTVLDNKLMAPTFLMFISEKKWQTFSPADQKAILAISGEKVARAVGKNSDHAEEVGRKALVDAKVEFIKGSPEFEAELKKAGQPLVTAWVGQAKKLGVNGQAVIDFYKAEVEKLKAEK
jgi:TRAP-type C4-dicarboxylate transport system substrate-binding protein